ncbi:hypothetical protein LTR46_005329 [Exophiala xenobiotica]|nr:hypothetical protein LTR46_005329 [Exophiala xenobiotica]
MACNNNQTELCGGPSRLNMYIHGNGTLPTSTPTAGTGGGNTPVQPTGLAVPPAIGNFSYVSCYTEATTGRALSAFTLADNSITLQTCASNCTQYRYFGVEYGRECYCGNTLAAGSAPATDGRCNMGCAGNSSVLCGGPSGLTLYNNTQWTTSTPATPAQPAGPTNVPSVGNYQYTDCHTEATNGRALTGFATASNDMTVQYCAGNCTGFTYFGVEQLVDHLWWTERAELLQIRRAFKFELKQHDFEHEKYHIDIAPLHVDVDYIYDNSLLQFKFELKQFYVEHDKYHIDISPFDVDVDYIYDNWLLEFNHDIKSYSSVDIDYQPSCVKSLVKPYDIGQHHKSIFNFKQSDQRIVDVIVVREFEHNHDYPTLDP